MLTKINLGIPIKLCLVVASSLFIISCSDSSATTDTAQAASRDSHNDGESNNRISVDSSSWSDRRSRLSVKGSKVSRNGTVTIMYGTKDDNGAVLGTTQADRRGDWEFRISDIDPVPCDVTAESSGKEDDKSVRRAPRDCSNDAGTPPPPPAAQCNDGIDNDNDGLIDLADPGCTDANDNDEFNAPTPPPVTQCNDGADNDNDGLIDLADPGCTDSTDNDEFNAPPPPPVTQCNDGADNDNDGLIDLADPGCTDATDNDEFNAPPPPPVTQCNDGADNDNDGLIDLADPGCTDATDNDEFNAPPPPPVTQCNDGADNDNDGLIDLADPGCTDATDNDEFNAPPPPPLTGNFTILAANDLGMHCADQDFRVFSILPPYNVMNAQVLRKGAEPQMMSPADGVYVTYQAAESNFFVDLTDPNRLPDFTGSMTATGTNLPGVFKNNFWQTAPASATGVDKIGFKAYENLYPPGVLAMFPSAPDVGLPAPDVAHYYLLSNPRELLAEQAHMPGILTNEPQPFHGYVEDFPFFVDFPFGYTVTNFKRYTAEGIPISAIDDMGRSNPYPLLRVEARDAANNILASVDAVAPVASEADCAICHAVQNVCDFQPNSLACDDIANSKYPDVAFIEDAGPVIGDTPEQKVINSAKTNILRLHDFKHNTSLAGYEADGSKLINGVSTTPDVVCANCHYSPALDLAHLGPTDMNGKEQTQHISMSRAMHGVHGALSTDPDFAAYNLFPTMPPPGASRDPVVAKGILMETCYNCHPGKRAECLRGAMGGSGTVCQDCHGQLTQVGDDFTEGFPANGFPAGADLGKRVPWASEPGCDSCHVGDVLQVAQLNQAGSLNDTVMNTQDAHGNSDDLRLLMTYRLSDHKANNGPDNLPLLKFPESRFAITESLYRLSGSNTGANQGHGGLSCEGCHGSTHAIWPNANPYANDNKAANDIQGHSGPIIECSSCHEGDLGNTLDGPHGMHPVGNTTFADGGHENMSKQNGDSCRACHGQNGEGTVLSRAAADRDFTGMKRGGPVAKGTPITCSMCHSNEL